MNKVLCFIVFFCAVLFLSCNSKKESKDYDGRVFEAQTVEGVNMTFEIISVADKTAQVGTGDNEKTAISKDYSGQITIPQEVNGYKVVRIGANAFRDCHITSAIMQEGVRIIEHNAFCGCKNLKKVKFPKTLTAIETYAFWRTSLSVIFIPKLVSHIGDDAFSLSETVKIEVDSENDYYDSREACNAIIESSTNKLLYGCKETLIPNTVEEINENAFVACNIVGNMSLPPKLKIVGESAFEFCTNIDRLEIPEGIQEIEDKAFHKVGITSINIPKSVISIGESAISAPRLCKIEVNPDNPKYDSRNNCNAIIETATNTLIVGCMTTKIPLNVTSIARCAMWYSDIEELVLPENLTSIGGFAFAECNKLKKIVSWIKEPFPLSSSVFDSFSTSKVETTLFVPKGTKEKYQQTKGWDKFKEIVEME